MSCFDDTLVTGLGSWQANAEDYSDSSYGGERRSQLQRRYRRTELPGSAQAGTRKDIEDRTDPVFYPKRAFVRANNLRRNVSARKNTPSRPIPLTRSATTTSSISMAVMPTQTTPAAKIPNRFISSTDQLVFSNTLFIAGSDIGTGMGTRWRLRTCTGKRQRADRTVCVHEQRQRRGQFFFNNTCRETNRVARTAVENQDASEKIVRGTYQWGVTETRSIQAVRNLR